jgi:hypothetical protein
MFVRSRGDRDQRERSDVNAVVDEPKLRIRLFVLAVLWCIVVVLGLTTPSLIDNRNLIHPGMTYQQVEGILPRQEKSAFRNWHRKVPGTMEFVRYEESGVIVIFDGGVAVSVDLVEPRPHSCLLRIVHFAF